MFTSPQWATAPIFIKAAPPQNIYLDSVTP